MLSYLSILSNLKAVLTHSNAIQGRVYLAPFFGSELNSQNLEQIANDSAGNYPKKYPLSLVLPPINTKGGNGVNGSWNDYSIQQLFLKQDGVTSAGDTQNREATTNRSLHTIPEDWHDMRRVAFSMFSMLEYVRKENLGDNTQHFRVNDKVQPVTYPVTRIGNDKLSGVLVRYGVSIFEPCIDGNNVEDYSVHPSAIVLPGSTDIHPEHYL